MRRIAYYAHHHGSGHMRHALNFARNPEFEVIVLSSANVPDQSNHVQSVRLELDSVEGFVQLAGQPFHAAPVGRDAGSIKRRAQHILNALAEFDPEVVICDVSAEITSLARLGGYPTVVRRMHGNRSDLAHQNMYANANQIISYFPSLLDRAFISEHYDKFTDVGMFALHVPAAEVDTDMVVVQSSLGGNGIDLRWVNKAALETPHTTWRVIGNANLVANPAKNLQLLGVVNDPLQHLSQAQVVISSTGHNAVRAAVSAKRPLLFVPEHRPYDEQVQYAKALQRVSDARLIDPMKVSWPQVLAEAREQDPSKLFDTLFISERQFHQAAVHAVSLASGEPEISVLDIAT